MMKHEDLAGIERLMIAAGITRLTLTSPQLSLSLVTADHVEPAPAGDVSGPRAETAQTLMPAAPPPAVQPDGIVVRARQVGLFQPRHATRRQPAVAPGVRVVAGEILGFVRDGMVLHPVRAERDGTISEVLLPEQAVVGYGTALFACHA